MKSLARACLRLSLLAAMPLTLSVCSCYGAPATYHSRSGRVIDRETHEGIARIRVDCVDAAGAVLNSEESWAEAGEEGRFELGYDEDAPCDHIEATDGRPLDGGEGRYLKASAPFAQGSAHLTILMDREK